MTAAVTSAIVTIQGLPVTRILHVGLQNVEPVFVGEQHESVMATTEYPIESGGTVIDHIIRRPSKLVLEGIVTCDPLTLVRPIVRTTQGVSPAGSVTTSDVEILSVGSGDRDVNRLAAAWAEFARVQDEGRLLTVATFMGTYRNMLIRKLSSSTGGNRGLSASIQIELQELQQAQRLVGLGANISATTGPAASRQPTVNRGVVDLQVYSAARQAAAQIDAEADPFITLQGFGFLP